MYACSQTSTLKGHTTVLAFFIVGLTFKIQWQVCYLSSIPNQQNPAPSPWQTRAEVSLEGTEWKSEIQSDHLQLRTRLSGFIHFSYRLILKHSGMFTKVSSSNSLLLSVFCPVFYSAHSETWSFYCASTKCLAKGHHRHQEAELVETTQHRQQIRTARKPLWMECVC